MLGRTEKSPGVGAQKLATPRSEGPRIKNTTTAGYKKKWERGEDQVKAQRQIKETRKGKNNSWRREIPRWPAAPMAKARQMQIYRGEKKNKGNQPRWNRVQQ